MVPHGETRFAFPRDRAAFGSLGREWVVIGLAILASVPLLSGRVFIEDA